MALTQGVEGAIKVLQDKYFDWLLSLYLVYRGEMSLEGFLEVQGLRLMFLS